jgi:hypothetical protein
MVKSAADAARQGPHETTPPVSTDRAFSDGDPMNTCVRSSLEEAQRALQSLRANEEALNSIAAAGALLVETFRNGGRVFSAGNGGSMCDGDAFRRGTVGALSP